MDKIKSHFIKQFWILLYFILIYHLFHILRNTCIVALMRILYTQLDWKLCVILRKHSLPGYSNFIFKKHAHFTIFRSPIDSVRWQQRIAVQHLTSWRSKRLHAHHKRWDLQWEPSTCHKKQWNVQLLLVVSCQLAFYEISKQEQFSFKLNFWPIRNSFKKLDRIRNWPNRELMQKSWWDF